MRIRELISGLFSKEVQAHHGSRRLECWWEPIYNPNLQGKLELSEWCFDGSAGPSEKFFRGIDLVSATSKGVLHEVKSVTFVDCDFQGNFDPETIVMFDKCRFIRCDFAYSYWRDTHFRECHFDGCSLSLASFSRCQFRDSSWERIGFSGSKTDFEHCHVTNPSKLVDAGYSGTRPGDKTRKHRLHQWYRLQGTKAHLARTLLGSHENTGDDVTFYQTARVHDLQQSHAQIAKNWYHVFFPEVEVGRTSASFGIVFSIAQHLLLRFFGLINGWGASILRPLLVLFLVFSGFCVIYRFFESQWGTAAQKSFNITSLVGYGEEYKPDLDRWVMLLQDVHVIISIIVYTVFFGTVISKLSRVR